MANMSERRGKRPPTQIDLQDALARATPETDPRIEGPNSGSLDNRFPLKRLKNKDQNASMPIGVHQQSTKSDAGLKAAAPRAPKSSWQTYEKLFDLQLGDNDYFTVAEKKVPDVESNSVVILKTFTGTKAESHVQAIRGIQHNRFVNAHLFFAIDDGYLVSFEFMPMALCEVAGNPLLNDLRLASILGQANESDNVGLDDPGRFPLAFEFLSATQRTSKIASIAQNFPGTRQGSQD
ncbi:hypothetical protein CRV24_007457 [Beauveria bassiana]|nr:hypothetical protein CRV24_007457 [Beauveria bassiana]